jgi:hypothetical protein
MDALQYFADEYRRARHSAATVARLRAIRRSTAASSGEYVDESIELTSDFFEFSYMKETHAGIEMQTFLAALGHSRDEGMKS